MRRLLGWTLEALAWWAAALGVWLLTLSSVDQPDLVIAILCALPCGVIAAVVRRELEGHWELPARAARWAAVLPAAIVGDTATVLAFPWRTVRRRGDASEGEWVRAPVEPGADDRPSAVRTAALAMLSFTPGSFGVHSDADTGELLVHKMASGPFSMIEAVRK